MKCEENLSYMYVVIDYPCNIMQKKYLIDGLSLLAVHEF
jgi:hypothetical protein